MKKFLTAFLTFFLFSLVAVAAVPVFADGLGGELQRTSAPGTVYLSGSGNDVHGDGSAESPYLSLEKALEAVDDGGTVVISDRIALPAGFNWTAHDKTVTVTGGVLDLSAFGSNGALNIRDNITFAGTELTFATIDWNADSNDSATPKSNAIYSRTYIYANGHHLVIAPDVTFTNTYNTNVWLFGGSRGGTLEGDTHIEVYAGTYTYIFGGNHSGILNGDTHLTVGGTVNPTAQVTNHDSNYNIYGGGMGDSITGSTHLIIQDSAKAIYARGGSYSALSKIGGDINTEFKGGSLMDLSGGNGNVNTGRGINLTMTGGTVQQVFGASTGAAFGTSSAPVTVNLRILGGTVTRRIYGGCYNDFAKDSSTNKYVYKTSYTVHGNIILTLDANATVSFSGGYADNSIFACSRYGNTRSGEHATLIFIGDDAYNRFKSKLCTNDFGSSWTGLMKGIGVADEQHICTYTVSSNTVTEFCSYSGCGHMGIAALTLNPAVALVYSGRPIEPAGIEYSGNWKGEKAFAMTYTDNVNAGTATVTASYPYADSFSVTFSIEKADATVLTVQSDETVRGKADGKIAGLTTATEYSTDGITYTAVTDPDMTFAAGTYYIRFPEDANHHASGVIELTVRAGAPLTVRFCADGSPDILREVSWDETLTDIPEVPARTGYTDTPPYWDVTDFTHIQKDTVVFAVYTRNEPAAPPPAEDTDAIPPENPAAGGCQSTSGFATMGFLLLAAMISAVPFPLFQNKNQ